MRAATSPHAVSPSPTRVFAAALMACLALTAAGAEAQPRPQEPLGPTIADRGSHAYAFRTFVVTSEDGLRRYKVQVAEPRKPAPAKGRQVVYLLDGNAAVAALDEALLATLAAGDAPVLVAIGYDVDTRFDIMARALDYTPPRMDGKPAADDMSRPGGGADVFLRLIEHRIMPQAEAGLRVDPDRRTLWGHSYGGLLTLYAALARPGMFQHYAAADPSLWWNAGEVLNRETAFLQDPRRKTLSLDIVAGGGQRRGPDQRAPTPMRGSLPPGTLEAFVGRLQAAGVDVTFQELPDQSHGALFRTALVRTLTALSETPAP